MLTKALFAGALALSLSASTSAQSSSAAAPAASAAAELLKDSAKKVAAARLIPTVAERIALLENKEYEFNFLTATTGLATGNAGHSVTASSLNFPALVGTGMSMTVGFLGPCGLNTPHTHPRATELNYVVNGTLRTGFLMENGARFVFNDAHAGSVSVFPQGAIHFEQNNGCDPVVFVAGFNSEDGGVTALAQRIFGLPPDILGAALGGLTEEQIAKIEARIPNNIALGAEECLKRCGITRPDKQMLTQRQPRNKGNALPAGFDSTPDPADLYPEGSAGAAGMKRGVNEPPAGYAKREHLDTILARADSALVSAPSVTNSPIFYALIGINGVFVLGSLIAIATFLKGRSSANKRGKFMAE